MKFAVLIAICCAAVALGACGSESAATPSPNEDQVATNKKPKVKPPPPPLPDELVINDLVEGSGPEAKRGDEVIVDYVGVNKHGKEEFNSWDDTGEPFSFKLGQGAYFRGWEEGIEGMKVGGRRELQIPTELAWKMGFLTYVIDLRKIK